LSYTTAGVISAWATLAVSATAPAAIAMVILFNFITFSWVYLNRLKPFLLFN
jgi:hypothetical protein